jgi:hypothetical protein
MSWRDQDPEERLCEPLTLHDGTVVHLYWTEDENGAPVPFEGKLVDWARDHEQRHRVAWDQVGPYEVSSIFVGCTGSSLFGPGRLYGLMVFASGGSGRESSDEYRFFTRKEALEAHQKVVAYLEAGGTIAGLHELGMESE